MEIAILLFRAMKINSSISESLEQCIARSAKYGYIKIFQELLKVELSDIQAMRCYQTIFWTACNEQYSDIVKVLLDTGKVNPAANRNICINVASFKGHIEIVELLLQYEEVYKQVKDHLGIAIFDSTG